MSVRAFLLYVALGLSLSMSGARGPGSVSASNLHAADEARAQDEARAAGAARAAATSPAAARGPALPSRPDSAGTIIDTVPMLPDERRAELAAELAKVSTEHDVPAYLVTLPSIAAAGGSEDAWTADALALALFREWLVPARAPLEPGAAPLVATPENPSPSFPVERFARRGVLLLVLPGDEKVAVAAGSTWLSKPEELRRLRRLMAHHFADADAGAAVSAGIEAVRALATGEKIDRPEDRFVAILLLVFAVVAILSIISFLRQGSDSVAWRAWSGVFSGLGWFLATVVGGGVRLTSGLYEGAQDDATRGRLILGRW